MRLLAHKVSFELEEDYKRCLINLKKAKDNPREHDPSFFHNYAELGLKAARLGYVFDAPLYEIIHIIRQTLPNLIIYIEMEAPNRRTLSGQIRTWLGVALLVSDVYTSMYLAKLPRQIPYGVTISESAYTLTEAFQAGVYQPLEIFSNSIKLAKVALEKDANNIDEKSILYIQELLAMLNAIADLNSGAFLLAWQQRFKSWKKMYSKKSKTCDTRGILDFETIAIARIAERYGLQIPADNPYAPIELLKAGNEH